MEQLTFYVLLSDLDHEFGLTRNSAARYARSKGFRFLNIPSLHPGAPDRLALTLEDADRLFELRLSAPRKKRGSNVSGAQSCTKCGNLTEFDDLADNVKCLNGKAGYCKDCERGWFRSYYSKNAKRINSQNYPTTRRWRSQNASHVKAYSRRYRETHPEYRARQAVRGFARLKQWETENPERARLVRRLQTHRRRAGGSIHYTVDQWQALCSKYDHRCLCCGQSKPLTVDHIVPLSRGGNNSIENIQPLCKSCNTRKKAQTIDYRR